MASLGLSIPSSSIEGNMGATAFYVLAPSNGVSMSTIDRICGTGVPGAVITLQVDNLLPFSVVVGGNGNWCFTPKRWLPNGLHTLKATHTIHGLRDSQLLYFDIANAPAPMGAPSNNPPPFQPSIMQPPIPQPMPYPMGRTSPMRIPFPVEGLPEFIQV